VGLRDDAIKFFFRVFRWHIFYRFGECRQPA
jgi:hypothetical protein